MPSHRAVLYLRVPASMRREIAGMAYAERRTLNGLANLLLETGLVLQPHFEDLVPTRG